LFEIAPYPDGEIRQLTDGPAIHPFSPAIHPDGRHIFFVRGGGIWEIDRITLEESSIVDFRGAQLGQCSLVLGGEWLTANIGSYQRDWDGSTEFVCRDCFEAESRMRQGNWTPPPRCTPEDVAAQKRRDEEWVKATTCPKCGASLISGGECDSCRRLATAFKGAPLRRPRYKATNALLFSVLALIVLSLMAALIGIFTRH